MGFVVAEEVRQSAERDACSSTVRIGHPGQRRWIDGVLVQTFTSASFCQRRQPSYNLQQLILFAADFPSTRLDSGFSDALYSSVSYPSHPPWPQPSLFFTPYAPHVLPRFSFESHLHSAMSTLQQPSPQPSFLTGLLIAQAISGCTTIHVYRIQS